MNPRFREKHPRYIRYTGYPHPSQECAICKQSHRFQCRSLARFAPSKRHCFFRIARMSGFSGILGDFHGVSDIHHIEYHALRTGFLSPCCIQLRIRGIFCARLFGSCLNERIPQSLPLPQYSYPNHKPAWGICSIRPCYKHYDNHPVFMSL